jgi:DNA polymerase I
MSGLDDVKLHFVNSMEEVEKLRTWLGDRRPVNALAFDLETSGLDRQKDVIRLAQIGDGVHGWAIPWDRWGGVLEDVVRLWEGDWIGHNVISFDIPFLKREGIEMPRHRVHDTMPMARINEPQYSMALKSQTARHVDASAGGLQAELAGTTWTWATVPVDYEPYWLYGALDPVLAYKLFEYHYPIIQRDAPKAYDLELAVLWVTQAMEKYGAHVDRTAAAEHKKRFEAYCKTVEDWCMEHYKVKPGSNASIIEILANEGFSFDKRTKSGAAALDAEVLQHIDHPLAQAVLNRRQLQKMASTYLRFYVEEADENNLVHPSINTLGAKTSRMSMSNPNAQNLPRQGTSKAGDVVRRCFTTRYGDEGTLIMCDFEQIEARLLAHYANEDAMITAFKGDDDFFTTLARQIFVDDTIVKKDPRRQVTKNATYAILYGAGIAKFAKTAQITEAQARDYMTRWNALYPGVPRFQQDIYNTASENKIATGDAFVRSPFTGRKYVADDNKIYSLVNYTVQGGAAELMKMKLVELDAAGLGEWMVVPVHDEIIIDAPKEHAKDIVRVLQEVMNDDKLLNVPIAAAVSHGPNWADKSDWVD